MAVAQPGSASALSAGELQKLREQTALLLDQAANYTCSLYVERVVDKRSENQKMEELARVDVAFIGNRERFAWPGDSGFQQDELRDILVMGLSGSGSFAEHLRTVVTGTDTAFGAPRQDVEGDRSVLRVPYHVPAARSGYLVNLDGNEIEAAIEGEITLLPDTLQVIAFSLAAKDLPEGFPATAVSETIRYQAQEDGSLRLPLEATQQMVESGTDVYDNRFRFEACRQFQSESEIRFGDDAPGLADQQSPAAVEGLPDGVPFEIELKSAVTWGSTRTGDEIEAVLTRPIKWKGEVLATAGSTVRGRVVELKRLSVASTIGYFVGLQFDFIDHKGGRMPLKATLETLTDMPKSARRGIAAMMRGEAIPFERMDRRRSDGKPYPNAGFVRILADTKGLPAGFAMRWVSGDLPRREQ